MAYTTLKAAIQTAIKNNDNEEITGDVLQGVLLSIVNSVGSGYNFAGVATPSTNPGTPDGSMFWIGGKGTYANFGSAITVPAGFLGLFMWDGSSFSRQVVKLSDGDGVFDITEYTGNSYASLSAALAAVPQEAKAGGMSVKFVQSSDNKYVQYRLIANQWDITEGLWERIDSSIEYNVNRSEFACFRLNDFTRFVGNISSDSIWNALDNPSYQHVYIPVHGGDIIEVTGCSINEATYCAFLKSYQMASNTSLDITGSLGAIMPNQTLIYTAPVDAVCFAFMVVSNDVDLTPISLKVNGYEFVSSLQEKLNLLSKSIEENKNSFSVEKTSFPNIKINNFVKYQGTIISSSTWSGINNSFKHIMIPLNEGDTIEIGKPSETTYCAFLKSYQMAYEGLAVDIAGQLHAALANQVVSYVAPADTKCFALTILYNDVNCIPETLKVNGYDYATTLQEKLNNIPEIVVERKTFIVDINGSGDFTSLRACMQHIGTLIGKAHQSRPSSQSEWVDTPDKTNKEFDVKIKPGTYDIRSYYTNEEWNTTDYDTIGLIIPRGVNLIGVGKERSDVVITCTSETSDIRKSTVNIQNDVVIENLTIMGNNVRYVVHDDFSYYPYANVYGDKRILKNVDVIGENTLYNNVYGAGTKGGADWKFINCRFINKSNANCWSVHDRDGNEQTKGEQFLLYQCDFIGKGRNSNNSGVAGIQFVPLTGNCEEDVFIIGCKFKGIHIIGETRTTSKFNINGCGNTRNWELSITNIATAKYSIPKFSDETLVGFNIGSADISYGDYVTVDANDDFEKSLSSTNYKALEDISVGTFGVVKPI